MTMPQLDSGDFLSKRGERPVGKTLGPYVKIFEEPELIAIEAALNWNKRDVQAKVHRGMLAFIPIPEIVQALESYRNAFFTHYPYQGLAGAGNLGGYAGYPYQGGGGGYAQAGYNQLYPNQSITGLGTTQ